MKLFVQYYLIMFCFFIIFDSHTYNTNNINTTFKLNNIKTNYNTYKDYLFWKEGKKIKNKYISLSIHTLYNHNTLKKENLEFLSLPDINFNNKNYTNVNQNYISKQDISYFDVKTPNTQIFYETSKYGQLIQTLFTHSPKKNINYSFHYQYVYPNIESQYELLLNNYFLTTFNYHDIENKYYKIWIHYINQKINNKIPIYINNVINIQRYYIGQYLKLNKFIYLLNKLEYEKKIFIYKEKKYKNFFSNVYINEPRQYINSYHKIFHELSIKYFFHKKNILTSGIAFYNILPNPNFRKIKTQHHILSLFSNIKLNFINQLNFNLFIKYFIFNYNYNFDKYYILLTTQYNNIYFNSKIESKLLIYKISPYFNIINNNFYKKNYLNNSTINQISFNILNKYINIYFNKYYINYNLKKIQYFNFFQLYFYKLIVINNIKYNIFIQIHNNNYYNNIINLPKLMLKNCVFYQNIFLKKILFQTGIILKYITPNLYKNYNTDFFMSDLLKDNLLKGFTFIDYFINIEFFRIKIYLLIQNINIDKFVNKKKLSIYFNNNKKFLIKIGLLWNMFT